MTTPRLIWSDSPGGEVEVLDEDHLGRELRRLHAESNQPIVATIQGAHGLEIGVGLGAPNSLVFVHRDREDESRDEWVTLGAADATGVVDFWFQANHHTQFERRHLVPVESALAVVLELYATGARSGQVAWVHHLV